MKSRTTYATTPTIPSMLNAGIYVISANRMLQSMRVNIIISALFLSLFGSLINISPFKISEC